MSQYTCGCGKKYSLYFLTVRNLQIFIHVTKTFESLTTFSVFPCFGQLNIFLVDFSTIVSYQYLDNLFFFFFDMSTFIFFIPKGRVAGRGEGGDGGASRRGLRSDERSSRSWNGTFAASGS